MARTPYELHAQPKVCRCVLPPQAFGTFRTLERAVATASGYVNVVDAFYFEHRLWLHWQIVDVRDGAVVWRDGFHEKGRDHGTQTTLHSGG